MKIVSRNVTLCIYIHKYIYIYIYVDIKLKTNLYFKKGKSIE